MLGDFGTDESAELNFVHVASRHREQCNWRCLNRARWLVLVGGRTLCRARQPSRPIPARREKFIVQVPPRSGPSCGLAVASLRPARPCLKHRETP